MRTRALFAKFSWQDFSTIWCNDNVCLSCNRAVGSCPAAAESDSAFSTLYCDSSGKTIVVKDSATMVVEDCCSSSDEDTDSAPLGSGSTGRYEEHEPFATIQSKMAPLCQSIGLGVPDEVQRMRGGSFNRVIGIFFSSSKRHPGSYVLRIPRDPLGVEADEFENQVAIAHFLEIKLPVPTIHAYDTTTSNAISRQYVLQNRVSGSCLENVYESLSAEERLHIASRVAAMIIRMEHISFPTAGRLMSTSKLPDRCRNLKDLSISLGIGPFQIDGKPGPGFTHGQSVKDILCGLINSQIAYCDRHDKRLEKWETLHEVILEMDRVGYLKGSDAVLWHWDFAARNILVDHAKDGPWEISGILDWNDVLSVPRVMSRKLPAWLWHLGGEPAGWTGDSDFLQQQRPLTQEEWTIKDHFDRTIEALSPGYYEEAYQHGRWVRRIARFALHGFIYSQDWKRYEIFMQEWRERSHI